MPLDKPDYHWLIDSRSRIQIVLVGLYELVGQEDKRALLQSDPVHREVFGLLMGAAFSLWRAAFLSHAERNWPEILKHATKFLEILIGDNAINYPQDRDTRDWTGGYYLNNARYRLLEAYCVFESTTRENVTPARTRLIQLDEEGIESRGTTGLWDTLYDALVELFQRLQLDKSGTF